MIFRADQSIYKVLRIFGIYKVVHLVIEGIFNLLTELGPCLFENLSKSAESLDTRAECRDGLIHGF